MIELFKYALTVFIGFFAIMNPIANIPVFISLVANADRKTKKRINKKATLTAFLIVLAFSLLGKFIFEMFGITIPAFKITGGILVFHVGYEMVQSKKPSVKHMQDVDLDENIAISPLAIPVLAGPGTIVTAMNYVANTAYIHIVIVIAIFGLMCYITYWAFQLGDFIVEKTGNNIITVIGKIMGLILAIIGVDMFVEGVKLAFSLT
ncbi:hypothetical protein AXE80_09930 [Wenyingzhuangia fucanilytica]|uniref:UPF0056 membrane protein n=1 Tax=Wenyingzhuangia fucanilytica TaxID=1790137 RepID=A0A1B1Y749_9FLAO|nr:MarC family protein [Wenyingzhuangia fucanilytica]ANW96577.1 hypothetical protein AXE80_09930 [Wenyingzhuangia fucanilytica]